jgi:O-antigen/teichoic acid export membrane protein
MRAGALRALLARPPELATRAGYNGLGQIAAIAVMVAITPLLLSRLGLDRFGVWSLALVILSTLTILDGGFAASLARFFALYAARGDRADSGRLLVGAFVFFALLGLLLTAVAFPLVPTLVGLLNVPGRLEEEAAVMLRWLPPVAALALMANSSAAFLQGYGMFRALAATMMVSTGTFAAAVVVLVQPGAHLRVLMIAVGMRYLVQVVATLLFAASHVSIRWPVVPARATLRELWQYASRMQVSALTGFVNSELDAIVIAAVLPVRYVGLYTIGLQMASAARSLPLYAFAPLLTRLTTIFRNRGRREAAAEFERLERMWLPAVLGYGAVAVAAVGFSVPVWLGDRYGVSGIVASMLLACYIVHVALTGVRTCYVRAVGRPGLEMRYSVVWTVTNAMLTVPFALVGGMLGVVAATAFTGTVASAYFVVVCKRAEGLSATVPERRWWAWAAPAVGLTVVGELAILQTDVHGFLPLLLTGLPALAGLALLAAGGLLGQRRFTLTRAPAGPEGEASRPR